MLASLALCSCDPQTFMEPTIPVDEVIKADVTAYLSAAPKQWDIVYSHLPATLLQATIPGCGLFALLAPLEIRSSSMIPAS